jgi:signal transduction histidine kinase
MVQELARSERELALKTAAERLRRAERLAAIGTLAAGIAHEINNPVNSILVTAEAARLAAAGEGGRAALERALRVIEAEAERCGRIVRNVLGLARDEHSDKEVADCNAIVRAAVEMAHKYARSRGARIDLDLDLDSLPVLASAVDLQQVLLNLIQNAVDAAENGEVTIAVATRRGGDGEVVLTVADDGPGMAPEVRDRVFDPFFSTRRSKGGTGLGLSLAHGIVAEHGGSIGVESEPGKGARFSIVLPPAREERAGD